MIWTLIVLHTALFLSVRLPFVQSWLGGRVSMLLSETLGTPATVGRVDLGFFNRVIIDDVIIPDLQGDTLLRAGRLSVKASLLPLLEGRFDITSAQLFGAHVRLYQADSTSAPNYQFVIDALSSGSDTTATPPLNLHIGSLIVRHSSVSYDRGGRAATGPGRAGTGPAPTFDRVAFDRGVFVSASCCVKMSVFGNLTVCFYDLVVVFYDLVVDFWKMTVFCAEIIWAIFVFFVNLHGDLR